ncbi:MAG: phosphate signaling complex protein PhoU [Actinomycetes bacterium]|jgi:phosphate transport system protein
MRDMFHEELEGINTSLLGMAALVKIALEQACVAITTADLAIAERVIAGDENIDHTQHDLDARIINLMARQQPVASDLRALVAALRINADLERMGDLAHHVAKLARMRYPNKAVPEILETTINDMCKSSASIMEKMITVIQYRDLTRALEIEQDDDEMDRLHRELIATLLGDNWTHGIETAIDMTLLGRYYERFADHAVSISHRVYFLVTGEYAVPRV